MSGSLWVVLGGQSDPVMMQLDCVFPGGSAPRYARYQCAGTQLRFLGASLSRGQLELQPEGHKPSAVLRKFQPPAPAR